MRTRNSGYGRLVAEISGLLDLARRTVVRSANSILTGTYWEIGRRIVEFEQGGRERARYGEELLVRLGQDLTGQYGRGFSWRNLYQMRAFYLGWEILQTPSAKSEARARLSERHADRPSLPVAAKPAGITILPTASAELASLLTTECPLS